MSACEHSMGSMHPCQLAARPGHVSIEAGKVAVWLVMPLDICHPRVEQASAWTLHGRGVVPSVYSHYLMLSSANLQLHLLALVL
jgi:hypothetical protein